MLVARNRPLRAVILVLDALMVIAAMALAASLHSALRPYIDALKEPPRFEEYALVVYLAVPMWVGLIAMFGLHRTFEHVWTRAALAADLIKLHVAGFLCLAATIVVLQTTINRSLIALFLGCSLLLSYAVRSALAFWQTYQHARGQGRTRLLLVGEDGPALQALLRATTGEPRPPEHVGQLGVHPVPGIPHLGSVEDIERILHEQSIDHVLFLPPYVGANLVAAAIRACETVGVAAEIALDLDQPTRARPRVVMLFGRPFMSFDAAPKPPERLAIKHASDWLAAAIGVIVLSPLFLVVSLLILVTMGSPVFFTQLRAGLNGRPFRMIKFRTMIPGAEAKQSELSAHNEMTGPVFKVANDPRVTRLGQFLRKTSIDELPQLFNVLLGQMSLVGPRPLPIKEQQAIRGWHRKRLSMKPGITGLWQVSGRSDIDFEQWMRLDQQYVDDWSLRLDLAILARTVPAVLFGRGAR